ncbi:hypothetical protein BC952_2319 [Flavobacterium limicola]|uniref:Glycosyl transferase family 2 n=1 Tax=Flavobacterium limicola TaxID=180441 RepID=A0A495RXY7_9FLAO|nr:glycosyl transferase family 2 [Flavobacterium limicola]RKS92422.1 hypothetical protein BC952_2319 [Flavobacterium limicola]
MQKNVSVILSTPISSESLKKVLLGYNAQTYRNFEVIIAVASTSNEINNLIDAIRDEVFYTIKQFSSNINDCLFINAIATNYIVFANGNSIPRFDFIEQHVKNREEGFFLSGEYNSISQEIFEKISEENINSGDCFELSWLKRNGNKNIFLDVFRYSKGLLGSFLNMLFKVNVKLNVENSSVWKDDLILILQHKNNLLDVAFFQELTSILRANNIKGRQIKYSAILLQQK